MKSCVRSTWSTRGQALSLLATSSILFHFGPVRDVPSEDGTPQQAPQRPLTWSCTSVECPDGFKDVSFTVDVDGSIGDEPGLLRILLGGHWKSEGDARYSQLLDDTLSIKEAGTTSTYCLIKMACLRLMSAEDILRAKLQWKDHTLTDTLGSHYVHPVTNQKWHDLLRTQLTECQIHRYGHCLPRLVANTLIEKNCTFPEALTVALEVAANTTDAELGRQPFDPQIDAVLLNAIEENAPAGRGEEARSIHDFLKHIRSRDEY